MRRALRFALRFALRLALCLFLPGFWLGTGACLAEAAPDGAFQRGNALYAAGKYPEAAAAYEDLVRSGAYSANLFYDLGNTYERLGQRGRSMLNYRRALLLEPAHSEALANLAFVQGRASGRPRADTSWLSRRRDLSAGNLWPILATVAAWAGLTFLALRGGPDRRWRGQATLCLAGCALAAGLAWWWDDGRENAGRAIVVAGHSRALNSPATNSKAIADLPAGSEVRVLSEQGTWIYAQAAHESPFWLLAADVENISPRHG